LVVGFFLWGNLISITGSFQLLTDHVSHLSGNAGKKKLDPLEEILLESHLADPSMKFRPKTTTAENRNEMFSKNPMSIP